MICRSASLLALVLLSACDEETSTTGACDVEITRTSTSEDVTVLYEGQLSGAPDDGEGWAEVITDAARLEEILGEEDFTIEAVDFSTHSVLLASVYVSSTCALVVGSWSVGEDIDGGLHLDLQVTDTSGACDGACDAIGHEAVMVAVPAGSGAGACATRADTCD